MGKYNQLDLAIRTIVQTDEEYTRFKELARQHFEGRYVWEDMPDVLKMAIAEWENENLKPL